MYESILRREYDLLKGNINKHLINRGISPISQAFAILSNQCSYKHSIVHAHKHHTQILYRKSIFLRLSSTEKLAKFQSSHGEICEKLLCFSFDFFTMRKLFIFLRRKMELGYRTWNPHLLRVSKPGDQHCPWLLFGREPMELSRKKMNKRQNKKSGKDRKEE